VLPPGVAQVPFFTGLCFTSTGVYNPKAFVLHAASLGQAFAHCRRFSTAATRRRLGSVSVPVCRAMLSHPVGVLGLVGRYPANNLMPRRPVPGRNHTLWSSEEDLAATSLRITPPFGGLCSSLGLVAVVLLTLAPRPLRSDRLACLIHAANVHSEPGSNPSKDRLEAGFCNPNALGSPQVNEKTCSTETLGSSGPDCFESGHWTATRRYSPATMRSNAGLPHGAGRARTSKDRGPSSLEQPGHPVPEGQNDQYVY
jgi:hypothetical protein